MTTLKRPTLEVTGHHRGRSVPPHPRNRRLRRGVGAALVALCWFAALPPTALAQQEAGKAQSAVYDVYLGVVPAHTAEKDLELSRMHRRSPHYQTSLGEASRHITVAIFRRPEMERVVDAEVTAEVIENDLIHVKRTTKQLNARELANAVTFCNFFDLHWNGKYRVNIRVHEPGRSPEQVTFSREEVDLRT